MTNQSQFKAAQTASALAYEVKPKVRGLAHKTTVSEIALDKLVRLPTVSGDTAANNSALDYIENFLRDRHLFVRRFAWNGVGSLVATTRHTKTPRLFLTGHIDVVPAPAQFYHLDRMHGRYYGRGVLDMKGAVAAFLGTVNELQDALDTFDFGIMITSDEESGSQNGASKLAASGYRSDVMIVPDGGLANWDIERLSKGAWHIAVIAAGRTAHGSRPWEGDNAIDKLFEVLRVVKTLFAEAKNDDNTMSIGTIHGGTVTNQIPDLATASIDIRFVSKKDQTNLTKQIADICQRRGVQLSVEAFSDAVVTDPADPYISDYKSIVQAVTGQTVSMSVSNAASDARWFAPKGVRCIVSFPKDGGHHGNDEWITQESLPQMQEIFVRYIRQVARKQVSVT